MIFLRGIHFPNPFQNGAGGNEWLMRFTGRRPGITLSSPEPTSTARDGGFSRSQVTRFYTLLSELQSFDIAVWAYGSLKLCFEQAIRFKKEIVLAGE
jgi:hypothetical protein